MYHLFCDLPPWASYRSQAGEVLASAQAWFILNHVDAMHVL